MKNQCQHLTETQHNELIKLFSKIRRVFQWNIWYLENRSIGLQIKRVFEANMFKTISSIKGKQIIFQEVC